MSQTSDTVAAVTGGASGIGRACAERFAGDGATVVVAAGPSSTRTSRKAGSPPMVAGSRLRGSPTDWAISAAPPKPCGRAAGKGMIGRAGRRHTVLPLFHGRARALRASGGESQFRG